MKPVFDKSGLLTTVVCDARTNKVLMVAWMNEESYALTKNAPDMVLVTFSPKTLA